MQFLDPSVLRWRLASHLFFELKIGMWCWASALGRAMTDPPMRAHEGADRHGGQREDHNIIISEAISELCCRVHLSDVLTKSELV